MPESEELIAQPRVHKPAADLREQDLRVRASYQIHRHHAAPEPQHAAQHVSHTNKPSADTALAILISLKVQS